jgi:hypothetical protein
MKECWINVYERDMGRVWKDKIGAEKAVSITDGLLGKHLYRLHIKLKDKPGLTREYPYNFETLIWSESRGKYDTYKWPMFRRVVPKYEKHFVGSGKWSDWD